MSVAETKGAGENLAVVLPSSSGTSNVPQLSLAEQLNQCQAAFNATLQRLFQERRAQAKHQATGNLGSDT
jgi:hypothetical protein